MRRMPPDYNETLARPPRRHLTSKTLIIGFSILILVGLVLLAALVIYLYTLTQTDQLTLITNGENRTVNTRAHTIQDVLQDYGITLYEGDTLSVDPQTPVQDGLVVRLDRARNVAISINGETQLHRTSLDNPAEVLASIGLTLAADDRITVDGTRANPTLLETWPVPVNQISIRRAMNISLQDGDTRRELRTNGETVGDALYDAGVQVYVADQIQPGLDAPVIAGMTIQIQRAKPATVIADGVSLQTRTRAPTVSGLLVDAGVALMGLDYAIPGEDVAVQPAMTVRVIRVREEYITETEIIPFGNVSQADNSLELDQIRLVQPGQNGLRRTDIRVRYENGVEVEREQRATVTAQQPQDRVVAYGTGVVTRSIDTPEGPRQYWRKIRMLTTSYHPAALGGDNITATGRVLTKGIVGVDPTVIPYGTQVYVPGYGVGIAADTGGPRSTRLWIDLGYDDDNWVPWSQYTDVYILTPVPDNIQYILPN